MMEQEKIAVELARMNGMLDVQAIKVDNIDKNLARVSGELGTKANKDEVKKKVDRQEFAPVKNIVYGLVSLILVAVVGAIVALVVK